MSKIATLSPAIDVRCGSCQSVCRTDFLEENADACPECGQPECWIFEYGADVTIDLSKLDELGIQTVTI